MEAKECTCRRAANRYMGIAVILGICSGLLQISVLLDVAQVISDLFIRLLKLVSLPIIFFSIVSTASGMTSVAEVKKLGKRVFSYTLLTTLIAATVALLMFQLIDPVSSYTAVLTDTVAVANPPSYWQHLVNVVPTNIIEPFLNNNVMGVLFIAMTLSLAILAIPQDSRQVLHTMFSGLYAAIMKMTTFIVNLMPIAIWAFITLFFHDVTEGLQFSSIAYYLACVVLANLIQAFIILPLFLKLKGISPLRFAKAMFPALSVAFFSKSSAGTLPMAMKCAEERAGISRKISSFCLPLCTTINMNGCAAFILITVLFVSMSHAVPYTLADKIVWIFLATIAAVGNAGVPMGCYFMASAFLAAMDVPLNILGVILPFYTLIDMLETAVNVWSDSCVTAVVGKETQCEPVSDSALIQEGI
jgi:Na+/H+-dicarboxylate symporter